VKGAVAARSRAAGGAQLALVRSLDQKAHVTGCLFESCKTGVSGAVDSATPALRSVADTAGRMFRGLKDFAVALGQDAIATSASAEPAAARQGVSATPR
jgi:hypothetical protein